MKLPAKGCECSQCEDHPILDQEKIKRLLHDMANCLCDDGDFIHLDKETISWLKEEGYTEG